MRDSTADFFGVGDEDCTGSEKWTNRRIRLQEKSHCGAGVKDDYIKRTMALDDVDFGSRNVYDPLHVGKVTLLFSAFIFIPKLRPASIAECSKTMSLTTRHLSPIPGFQILLEAGEKVASDFGLGSGFPYSINY